MELNVERIIGLYGMKGSGKTTLGRYFMDFYLKHGVKVILYNTDFETETPKANLEIFKPIEENAISLDYLNRKLKEFRATNTNTMIYIRDLDAFFDKNTSLSKASAELKDISTRGRHSRTGLIYESKQPRYIPAKLISNTDLFFIGNFAEAEDLRRFKFIGNTDILTTLPPHIFFIYDRWTGEKYVGGLNLKENKIKVVK